MVDEHANEFSHHADGERALDDGYREQPCTIRAMVSAAHAVLPHDAADLAMKELAMLGPIGPEDSANQAQLVKGAKLLGRLGETAKMQSLIDQHGSSVPATVRYDLYRYLLNAAAVNGDVTVAAQALDLTLAVGPLSDAVAGGYLRSVWISTHSVRSVTNALFDLAEKSPIVPRPTGLIELIDGQDHGAALQTRAILKGLSGFSGPNEMLRDFAEVGNVDEILAIVDSEDAEQLDLVSFDAALRAIAQAQRSGDMFHVVGRMRELGRAINAFHYSAMFMLAASLADRSVVDDVVVMWEHESSLALTGALATAMIRAYGAVGDDKMVLATLTQLEQSGPADRRTIQSAISSLIDAGNLGKARELALAHAEHQPMPMDVITQLVHRLGVTGEPEQAEMLIEGLERSGQHCGDRVWEELVDEFIQINSERTVEVLAKGLLAGHTFRPHTVNQALQVVARNGALEPHDALLAVDMLRRAGSPFRDVDVRRLLREAQRTTKSVPAWAIGQAAARAHSMDLIDVADLILFDVATSSIDAEAARAADRAIRARSLRNATMSAVFGDASAAIPELDREVPSADVFVALLTGYQRAGMTGECRALFDNILDNNLVEPSERLWAAVLPVYIGRDDAPQVAKIVDRAKSMTVSLGSEVVRLAIVACGDGMHSASHIQRLARAQNWITSHDRLVNDEVAAIAAAAGDVRQTVGQFAGVPTTRNGMIREQAQGRLDQQQWGLYLRALAFAGENTQFDTSWRYFTNLYQADKAANLPKPRRHNAYTWSARVVKEARSGRLDQAYEHLFDRVLSDPAYPAAASLFEALLHSQWTECANDSVQVFRRYIAAGEQTTVAWMLTQSKMAVESGAWELTRELAARGSSIPGLQGRTQDLWVGHANACVRSQRPGTSEELAGVLTELLGNSLVPSAATLTQIIDAGRSAGSPDLLNSVATYVRATAVSPQLSREGRIDLLDRLAVGFADANRLDTAMEIRSVLVTSGRNLSVAADIAMDSARVRAGLDPEGANRADPLEALQAVGIVIQDVKHEIGGILQGIDDSVLLAERGIDKKDPRLIRLGLGSAKDNLNVLRARVTAYESLLSTLRAGEEDVRGVTSLKTAVESLSGEARILADVRGTSLQVDIRRSNTRNNKFFVKSPEFFIDVILKNLVRNAASALRKMTEQANPTVTILVSDSGERSERFPSGWVTLSVIDNGPGFPDKNRELLAAKAYMSRGIGGSSAGLGTGLALVNTIAWMVGAELVIPRQGTGTTIEIHFQPAAEEQDD